MRLVGLSVSNFRCFGDPVHVRFDDLTALVGRNDVGKSSLLEALAVFFETASLDKDDASKHGDPAKVCISCEFDRLPSSVVIDAENKTDLESELLLSPRGTLVIKKTFNCTGSTPKPTSVCAIARHPASAGFSDLHSLKKADLIKRAADLGVNLEAVDKRLSAPIRAAIWAACPDALVDDVHVSLESESGKQVWSAMQGFLPAYSLFKSDRTSSDQDAEAQDPMKAAIREAVKSIEHKLQEVRDHVETEVRKIAEATMSKLREMDATIADSLNPVISTKKWDTLFSTSITGDAGIPLNKRGSGVRRLVLLNFFRAQVERDASAKVAGSVIYAIEEPETSQHPRNQRLLMKALRELSASGGRQVIVTTHTPMLARSLSDSDIRFVREIAGGARDIVEGSPQTASDIASSLGVLPDHTVKLFIGVEGPNDISFLTGICRVLRASGENVPDLEKLEIDGDIIFIPLGGSNLALWGSRLRALNRPEYHICDRDNPQPDDPKYQGHMNVINARNGCRAVATAKRELENYIHRDAISEFYATNGIHIAFATDFADFDDVPEQVAEALHLASGGQAWATVDLEKRKEKVRKVKARLNGGVIGHMSPARLTACDPANEIRTWLGEIGQILNAANL